MIYFRTIGIAAIASIGILIALGMLLDRDTASPAVDGLIDVLDDGSVGLEGAFVDGQYRLYAPMRPPLEWYFTFVDATGALDDCDGAGDPPDSGVTTYADESLLLRVEQDASVTGYYCYYIGIPVEFLDTFVEIQISGSRQYLFRFERIPSAPLIQIGAHQFHQYGLGHSVLVASNESGPFLGHSIWLFDYAQ